MKIAGIIAEYNPFHNGHAYHMQEAKKQTGADYCIAVMSGDYVQRGVPAILDKYTRTKIALEAGADLVLELPVPFATGSAEIFSSAAIHLLDAIGVTDTVCFGSENGRLKLLSLYARILCDEPELYKTLLQENLRSGCSYPRATYQALTEYILRTPALETSTVQQLYEFSEQLSSPNNILGVEYLKALFRAGSTIRPHCINRKGGSYHSQELTAELSSATAIRQAVLEDLALLQEKLLSADSALLRLKNQLPDAAFTQMQSRWLHTFPVTEDDFSPYFYYQLLNQPSLSIFADMSTELEERIRNQESDLKTFREWADCLKTKNYTMTRIQRALLHTILNITKEDMIHYHSIHGCSYARILGFRTESSEILSEIKKKTSIPIISKVADAGKLLDATGMHLLNQEIQASRLYHQVVYQKFKTVLPDDYRSEIIRV